MNENTKCRVCLTFCPLEDSKDILGTYVENGSTKEGQREAEECSLADLIEKYLNFKPTSAGEAFLIICIKCWIKIHDFHQFYVEVEKLQETYKYEIRNDSLLEPKIIFDDYTYDCDLSKDVPFEDFRSNIKSSDDGGTQLSVDIPNPISIENTEDEDVADPFESGPKADDDIKTENLVIETMSEADYDELIHRDKKGNVHKANVKAAKSSEPSKTMKMNSKDEELIRKHISLNCGLCGDNVIDFDKLRQHFRERHEDEKAFIRCCSRKIFRRCYLVSHAYWHENPEQFKCEECQKPFADVKTLQFHRKSLHANENELKFNCDQCDQRFAIKRFLDQHKSKHLTKEEWRFFCEQCPEKKVFRSNHLLQVHICMRHKRPKLICDICAKVYRSRESFTSHVRSHGETGSRTKIKCPKMNCESWLTDKNTLRQHIRRQHDTEDEVQECQECGRTYKNSRNLKSHVRYAHSKKVFDCKECNKTFKSALTLKEHMANHTGETLYKCPFCERKFNSNANMHSHKKKMHPAEWQLLRKTKMSGSQTKMFSNESELTDFNLYEITQLST